MLACMIERSDGTIHMNQQTKQNTFHKVIYKTGINPEGLRGSPTKHTVIVKKSLQTN